MKSIKLYQYTNCPFCAKVRRKIEELDIKDKFEKKEITEDDKFAFEKKLQEITDEFVGKIEVVGETKRKELLQI